MSTLKMKRSWSAALSLIALIAVGIALNVLGTELNGLLGLPLYIDDIGTILTAMLGGYIPCITVGFFTNVINGLSDSYSMYYCVISVFIAVAAVAFADKLRKVRFPHVIYAVLTFAALGGIVGGALTWLINGLGFGEGFAVDMAAGINRVIPMGYFLSNILSSFLIDLVDKAIVTAIALIIYKLLPLKLKDHIKAQSWYYISMIRMPGRADRKRISLSVKVTLLVALSTTLVASAAIGISIMQYNGTAVEQYKEQGEYVTRLISDNIKADRVDDYLRLGREAEGYANVEQNLYMIRDAAPEIKYIYVYKIEADGTHVVFDLDTEEVSADEPGSVIDYDTTIVKYKDRFQRGEDIPSDITDDSDGWLLSVYEPIRDESGKTVCYVGADLSMNKLRSEEYTFLAKVISLFIGFLILIRTYAVWAAERHIIRPVNTIADAAKRFTYDTPQAREESMRMIESLDISTGDEIEHLYEAYKKTTADTVRYIDEVQHKSEQLTKLQNGLILVLADIVESRDQCTGDHVRKTAAYTRIILDQMKEEGIYADILTDDYIEEVVNSAPLHDVGKIKVSDTILNKPGRLTDEEFIAMQNHTTAGGEIIDKAIAIVDEESEYLNEAKNLATFHHEKWNGTGYPTGLSGEDIPLSARVMAVADVFDALVSRRSYKEPFTVEKAFEIIREGSGSHFDPEIVKAFLDAEDEVRRVAKLNMEI